MCPWQQRRDATSRNPGACPKFHFSGGDIRNVFITLVFCYLLDAFWLIQLLAGSGCGPWMMST